MTNEELFHKLLERLPSETITLKKKKFHTFQCGPDYSILVITSGLLMTVRSGEDGRFIGTGLYDPYTILGFSGFCNNSKEVTCYAIENTVVQAIPTRLMNQLLQQDIELCHAMLTWMVQRSFALMDDLEASALLPLDDRITFFENKVKAMQMSDEGGVSNICLSIALGAHPVSVSRAHKRLKSSHSNPDPS